MCLYVPCAMRDTIDTERSKRWFKSLRSLALGRHWNSQKETRESSKVQRQKDKAYLQKLKWIQYILK